MAEKHIFSKYFRGFHEIDLCRFNFSAIIDDFSTLPADRRRLFNKCVDLFNQGKHDEAINAYDEAIRLNPNDYRSPDQ